MEKVPTEQKPEEENVVEATIFREQASKKNRISFQRSPLRDEPKVCFVILHRAGEEYLRRLFSSFLAVNTYRAVEFSVVLHACNDDSRGVIQAFQDRLQINITDCPQNMSFAYSNNRAAERTAARVLIFLNNDIVFQQDVVLDLLQCLQQRQIGLAGCGFDIRLLRPSIPRPSSMLGSSFGLIRFTSFIDHLISVHLLVCVSSPELVEEFPAVTAALVACRRDDFLKVGGFYEGYMYGYEDVDLALTFKRIAWLEIGVS